MLKHLPIRFKLFVIYASMGITIFSASFSLYYINVRNHLEHQIKTALSDSNRSIANLIETAATISIKIHLRAIAEKNLEIIEHIYQDYQRHLIGEKTAKAQAEQILLSQKIGQTGYIYIVNSQGDIKAHPQPRVKGQNHLMHGFIQKQTQMKKGYLEYLWQNPKEVAARPKAMHMVYFKPWDWIISVTSYKSEFAQLVSVEDFKDKVLAVDVLHTGYCFVIDSRGNFIIHPQLNGNLLDYADAEGKKMFRQIIQQKKGIVHYFWRNPGDSLAREKLMAFDYLPDLKWIIGSSTYTDKAFSPLAKMRHTFFYILAGAVALIALVTLAVSTTITRPLTSLINRFNANVDQDKPIPLLNSQRRDEIGDLESSFNAFMVRLETYKQNLLQEIRIRKEAETQLQLFEKVFENANEGITITGINGDIQAVNQAFTDITGYDAKEVTGQNPRILKSDRHDDAFYRDMWQALTQKGQWSGEIWNRKKTGEAFPEFLSISAIRDNQGEIKNYVAVFHDISEMKTKERQIKHMAYHDPLTGLPNRSLLKDRLENAINQARRQDKMVQLIFIDLDNFKNVNDSAGHARGDEMLKEAAGRLLAVTRISDTVARFGGDEFIIMITDVSDMMEIIGMVKRIQKSFSTPFKIDGKSFHITCSIGIAVFPGDGNDAETLVRHADLAMYHSKERGKDRYHLFEKTMAKRIHQRIEMETSMRKAIENDEFQVYFQPQVNNLSLLPVGIEALVRWIKSDGSIVAPNQFIPLAEESGLIVPIGEKIIKKAIGQTCQVRKTTGLDLVLSVNVSARQMDDPGFDRMIHTAITDLAYPSGRLKIEITESLLMQDLDTTNTRLKQLSDMGISTAIDDFGTGYSSLAYIKQMPISTLKIDKSFIDDICDTPDAFALVETIVLMANNLNMSVVAEGVEHEDQLDILKKLGNMDIQGYVFAKPMPLDELESWLKKNTPARCAAQD